MKLPENIKYLFWDTNFNELNLEENIEQIVTRIIMYGDDNSYEFLFKNVDKERILEIINTEKEIDAITRNYWNLCYEFGKS